MGLSVGIGAAIIVVLGIWLWLNLSLTRGRSEARAREDGPGHTDAVASDVDAERDETALTTGENSNTQEAAVPVSQSSVDPEPDSVSVVEVLAAVTDGRPKVFDRIVHPFRLNDVQVPVFAEEQWKRCFYQLTEDKNVLGWAAFEGDALGASDREYDATLIDVLRNCQRGLERLRHEVGLSQVYETMLAGDEGRVWLVSAVGDIWFALFLDATVDFQTIASNILSSVRRLP